MRWSRSSARTARASRPSCAACSASPQILGGEVELFGHRRAGCATAGAWVRAPAAHAQRPVPTTVTRGRRRRPAPACGLWQRFGARRPRARRRGHRGRRAWPAARSEPVALPLRWAAAARPDRPRPRGRGRPAGHRRADGRGRRGEPAGPRRQVARLAGDGTTMLVVTHEPGPSPTSCTRAVVLRDGRIAYDGPLAGAPHARRRSPPPHRAAPAAASVRRPD